MMQAFKDQITHLALTLQLIKNCIDLDFRSRVSSVRWQMEYTEAEDAFL